MTTENPYRLDDKWVGYFPALDAESLAMLEASILDEGQRDPIVCTSDGVVVDGHNRLDILQRHGIAPHCHDVELRDDNAIEQWLIANQLGRRNVAPGRRQYFRGRLAELKSAAHERQSGSSTDATKGATPLQSVLNDISQSQDVTPRSLRRDRELARNVDQLAPAARREFLAGGRSLLPEQVKQITTLPTVEQTAAVRRALNGKAKPPPAPNAGSVREFLTVAREGHKQCLSHLSKISRTLTQLSADKRSAGYLSTQITRVVELITDLRSYIKTSEPVSWEAKAKRWRTKQDEKQRERVKPKRAAKK